MEELQSSEKTAKGREGPEGEKELYQEAEAALKKMAPAEELTKLARDPSSEDEVPEKVLKARLVHATQLEGLVLEVELGEFR